ncbi:MAG: FtsB family cell division protein [Acidimicrobiia bacterium]
MPVGASPRKRSGEQRRGFSQRVLYGVIVFVACVLLADALIGERGLLETTRAMQRNRAAADEILRLNRENATLREEARRLREDPDAIEEIARRELGLIKPGEKLFIIKDVTSSPNPQKQ